MLDLHGLYVAETTIPGAVAVDQVAVVRASCRDVVFNISV